MPSGGTAGCASLNIPYLASSLVLSASGLCININFDRSSAFDEEVDSGSAWASFELKLIFHLLHWTRLVALGGRQSFPLWKPERAGLVIYLPLGCSCPDGGLPGLLPIRQAAVDIGSRKCHN